MAISNGRTSGTAPTSVGADYNISWAPAGTIIIADGYGNVASSEIPIAQLLNPSLPEIVDEGTF
jgi:hypothetical protein